MISRVRVGLGVLLSGILNPKVKYNKLILLRPNHVKIDAILRNCSGLFSSFRSYNTSQIGLTPNFRTLLGKRNPYLYKSRCSTFVNSDNLKLELYLRNITVDVLLSKFNISRDEPIFQIMADKALLEENLQQSKELKESLEQLKSLKDNEGKDTKDEKEMLMLAEEDIKKYTERLKEVYAELIEDLIPKEEFHDCNDIVLEIAAGVGGLEAMLFASELKNMYCSFLKYKGWQYTIAENDESELGGVRHCSMLVSGPAAYRTLQHEAGVHRVQRVPATERGGRVHTSTVSVAVLPQPSEIEVDIKENELKIETKRASGAGGQHVNTTDSAVRITHLPTGIAVECQSGRNQHQNRTTALNRLRAKIYEKELNKMDSNIRSQRKSQVGSSGRSEKIRTYNFRDDRISDHRLSMNIHNLKDVLSGGESLDKILVLLAKWHHSHKLKQFIDTLPVPL